ncbi:MAG: RNA-binding protein [Verrucomicrobiota bacterium JB022]|nr:RNA-binding protein [Verrucomicrobiota bacterium JB022]
MKLFVGNVNWDAPVEEIKAYLGQFGEIEDFFYPLDRETGRPRGFCFVTYTNEEDAQTALKALDGAEFAGRPLKANPAVPKEDLGGGAPRGPRGGGGDRPRRPFNDGPRGGGGGGFRPRSDAPRGGGERGGWDRGGDRGFDRGERSGGGGGYDRGAPRGERSGGSWDRGGDDRPRRGYPTRPSSGGGEDDGVRIRVPRRRYTDDE